MPELTGTYLDDLPEEARPQPAPPETPGQTGTWLDDLPARLRPQLPPERLEQQLRLQATRKDLENKEESTGSYARRKFVPWLRTSLGVNAAREYSAAQQRLQQGQPLPHDYSTIAGFEKAQQEDRERSFGGRVGEALGGIPATLAEFGMGAAAAKPVSNLLGRGLAAAGVKAASAGAAATASVAVPRFLGQAAVTTALVPEVYARRWASDNLEHGRDPTDFRSFPAAFGLGMVQTAVLGSLQHIANGVGSLPLRLAAKGAAGAGEQMALDAGSGVVLEGVKRMLPEWAPKQTPYGTLGQLVNGDRGEGMKELAIQFLTFAAFGALHEAQHGTPTQQRQARMQVGLQQFAGEVEQYQQQEGAHRQLADRMQPMLDWLDRAGKKGNSAEQTAAQGQQAMGLLGKLLQSNPNPTRAEAAELFKGATGPMKEIGDWLAGCLPEKTSIPQQAPAPPATGKSPFGVPQPAAAPAAQAAPAPAPERPQQPAGPQPATLAEGQQLLAGLGVKTRGMKPEAVKAKLLETFGSPEMVQAAVEQMRQPPRPQQPAQKPTTFGEPQPTPPPAAEPTPTPAKPEAPPSSSVPLTPEPAEKHPEPAPQSEVPAAQGKPTDAEILDAVRDSPTGTNKEIEQALGGRLKGKALRAELERLEKGDKVNRDKDKSGRILWYFTPPEEAPAAKSAEQSPEPASQSETPAEPESKPATPEQIATLKRMIQEAKDDTAEGGGGYRVTLEGHSGHYYVRGLHGNEVELQNGQRVPLEQINTFGYETGDPEYVRSIEEEIQRRHALGDLEDHSPADLERLRRRLLEGSAPAAESKPTEQPQPPEPVVSGETTAAKPVEKTASAEADLHDLVEQAVNDSELGTYREIKGLVNGARKRKGLARLEDAEISKVLDSLEDQGIVSSDTEQEPGQTIYYKTDRQTTEVTPGLAEKLKTLSPKERHVLTHRASRTLEDIAGDPEMAKKGGGRLTRERVRQIEARAIEKIGGEQSAAEAHKLLAPVNELDAVERGHLDTSPTLEEDPETPEKVDARHQQLADIDAEITKLSKQLIRESASGKLTPERIEEIRTRVAALDAQRTGRSAPEAKATGDAAAAAGKPTQRKGKVEAEETDGGDLSGLYGPEGAEEIGKPLSPEEKTRVRGGQPDAAEQAEALRQTALAKQVRDQERQRRKQEEIHDASPRHDEEVQAHGEQVLHENPQAAHDLLGELEREPRPLRDFEGYILAKHKTRLLNEADRVLHQAIAAGRDLIDPGKRLQGEARDQAIARQVELEHRLDELNSQLDRFDKVVAPSATEAGRGVRFLGVLMAEDFSLHGMLRRARLLKKGELTPEEAAKVTELQKRIAELEKQIQDDQDRGHGPGSGNEEALGRRAEASAARRRWGTLQGEIRDSTLSRPQRLFRGALGVLDVSRAIMTAFDLSAVFRQGGFLSFAHPLKMMRAFPDMLRAFRSEGAANRAMQQINERPNAELYRRSGLFLSEPDAHLNGQEEAFIGRWVKKIPGLAGSERAFNTFLNRMRADVFDSMLASFPREGRASDAEARAIANFVNKATGRGGLGKLEDAAVPLSRLFFSPRFLASRFQLLAGQPFYQGTTATRGKIALEYARALTGVGLFYALYKMADDKAKLSFDPRSADFGKVVTGNTHIDPLAGLAQVSVFMSRLASGQTKSTTSGKVTDLRPGPDKKKFGQQEMTDVISRFIRSKLAPIPGAAVNLLSGENVVGEPVTLKGQAWELAHPIAGEDVYKALKDQGLPQGAINGLLALLGMGEQVYERRRKK